jgi:hypothetical protein
MEYLFYQPVPLLVPLVSEGGRIADMMGFIHDDQIEFRGWIKVEQPFDVLAPCFLPDP